MATSKTIVLIHGNFVNNTSWTEWKRYYEQKGYTVHTPANPGHDGNPADLRKTVHPDLVKTGFIDVVNNISKLIDGLPAKPLVIGHSMAGMAAMKLLELGKAGAAVSIDGAPPKNVFPPFTTLKAVLPAFGFFSFKKYFMGSRAWYNKCFFNTLPENRQGSFLGAGDMDRGPVKRSPVAVVFDAATAVGQFFVGLHRRIIVTVNVALDRSQFFLELFQKAQRS